MPSLETICYYAMYVIGEVESNWNWTSINYNDPITIGMMQWYGVRAAALLNRVRDEMPDEYGTLAQSLRDDLDAHAASSSYWNTRYLTRAEGNSIITVFQAEANHQIQENQAIADFERYIDTLESWGMSTDDPKPLIFAMSMYHQSPAQAGKVIGTAGGSATLDRLRSVCLNDSILGQYRNRYNTVYGRLVAWDGESNPPDFGQSGEPDTTPGGDIPGISEIASAVNAILQYGDELVLVGPGDLARGLIFHPAGYGRWVCSKNVSGTEIEEGNTGGGSETGPAAAQDIVDLYKSWENRFAYSQGGGRLNPIESGYGDCSSTVWFAYQQVSGIDIGTWTGAQMGKGRRIASGGPSDPLPIDQMQLADLVLIDWPSSYTSTYDHVELYVGDNSLWGHGGPGVGPNLTTSNAEDYTQYTLRWEVRRYL